MSYGTKFSTSCDSKSVSNDFVSCGESDKSLEVTQMTLPLVILVSNLQSTSQLILPHVHQLPVTSCNKNGYFNKKAGHFRKNASSVSKLCFVCGSGTHLIKDCNFYEKKMANKTVSIGVGPTYNRNKVNYQIQFVPQVVLLRTGKIHIPPNRLQPVPTGQPKVTPVPTGKPKVTPVPTGKPKAAPVPTGKPQMSTPVPTGRPNRPFPVLSDRGYSPSENPFSATEDEGIFNSGCSRSMTGNRERLDDFQAFYGRKVTFGGGEGRITRREIIRTPTLDFENVYCVKELQQFNLFSISWICDKKNQVLFTDTECLVLSKDFKLPDDSMVVLKVPRKHNLYAINLNDLCPRGNLACLVVRASFDDCVKWHRRMAHVNYKNMNRLVKGNLVRGLPPKLFKNGHTCVACCKGKQNKATYKAIHAVSSIFKPLQLLHMNLFRPTSIRSIDHKYYCLVITDDYSRFCWVFFLAHKDETYPILKDFINLVENELNIKVKAIRCDNGTKFKNAHIIELFGSKRIKREYSNPRTPQQNEVAERKNRTLIEAARTSWLTLSYLLCFELKHHFKPFGCHVTILNISDHLGKFDGKSDEGYIGLGHEWYFDLDYLTDSLGYKHVLANQSAGTQGATTNSVGTPDTDSDSNYDEQVIISADEIFQKELARLKDQEQRVTSDAESLGLGFANHVEELRIPAGEKAILPSCIPVPTGSVPVPTGSVPFPTSSIPVPIGDTLVSSDDVLVYTSSSNDLMFDGEPTTRFPYPSDLGNHDPSPVIFSSLSYDAEFGADLNNMASTVEEEMQQFKFQNVWVLVDLPAGKYAIGTKWILKNKRDARGIVNRGHLTVLAFASYMGFLVYQMDVKSAFLYGRIDKEVYVTQPKGFVDPQHPKKVYKVVKALYGLHQALKAWTTTTPYEALKPKSKYESDSPVNQTIVATSSTEAEYVTTANCYGQFWSMAKLRAPELGPPAILATFDKTPYTITEDLVRSRLQLADDGETRVTRQYKVLVFSSKLFANMRFNFTGHPMPLLPAMLLQAQTGKGAESLTLMRQMQALSQLWKMQLWEAISIPLHQGPLMLPLQVNLQEAHKKLFKDEVGKLVKKVKTLEVKLKTKKRKIVVSDYDQEDGHTQDVDLDALRALANAAVTVDLDIPSSSTSQILAASPSVPTAGHLGSSGVPPGASDVPIGASIVPTDVPSRADPTGVTCKGKSLMVEEDIPVSTRTFRQMEKDRLGEEAAKWLHDEEMAQMERQRVEVQRKRQQDVLDSAMYYNESDWLNIRAQVKANASFSKTLLRDDVSEDNFPAKMVALIRQKRQDLAAKLAQERQNMPMTQVQQKAYMIQYVKNQSSAVYTTRWTMAYVKSFTDEQLKQEFEKIHKNLPLKGQSEAPTPSMPEVPISPDVSSPLSSRTWRKTLGQKHILNPKSTLPKLDLDTKAQSFINVVVNEDSDDEEIRSWRLYTLSNVHVLETVSGELPPKQTPPEVEKQSCTSLLLDLLAQ
uniref:Integrase catalytic domain-containing protein n=1 Tax=Tanacetum cinerariifolium TaxID=118510 RepID=A0A6L2P5Y6_TANCI|nr:hypothetical protein [Tanacetum cinerariifolium]